VYTPCGQETRAACRVMNNELSRVLISEISVGAAWQW